MKPENKDNRIKITSKYEIIRSRERPASEFAFGALYLHASIISSIARLP